MTRTPKTRVTVPPGSVALVLSQQLAEELQSLLIYVRQHNRAGHEILQSYINVSPADDTPSQKAQDMANRFTIAGDIMLALLEVQS